MPKITSEEETLPSLIQTGESSSSSLILASSLLILSSCIMLLSLFLQVVNVMKGERSFRDSVSGALTKALLSYARFLETKSSRSKAKDKVTRGRLG